MLFLAILLLAAIWILTGGTLGWRRVTAAANAAAADTATEGAASGRADAATRSPKVSVVSYVLRDEDALDEYIGILLAQDYPDTEIVLVCDASAEATAKIAEKYETIERLHITFIPPGSHNLSRRKLAQTVGIKAATGEVVLLTSSSVFPVSTRWVSLMAAPFATDSTIAVTLGYVHPVADDFSYAGRWYRQFDHLLDSTLWMDAAITGNPFRGDGFNMAFRRQLFFDNKGYASTIPLMDGDDDIFIRELSRFGPVSLQLAPDAILDSHCGQQTDKCYAELKDRRMFTRRYLPKAPFLRQGFFSCCQWLMVLSVMIILALCILPLCGPYAIRILQGLPWWLIRLTPEPLLIDGYPVMAVALVTLVATWCAEARTYRRLSAALGSARLFFGVVPFLLWRPIGDFIFRMKHFTTRKSHFTWQR